MFSSFLFLKTSVLAACATVLVPVVWASDGVGSGLDGTNPGLYRLMDDALHDASGWERAGPSTPVGLLPMAAGWQFGRLRVQPSLFLPRSDAPGAGVWFGWGDRWFAGVGARRTALYSDTTDLSDSGEHKRLLAGYRWRDQQSLSLQWQHDGGTERGRRMMQLMYGAQVAGNQTLSLRLSAISGWDFGSAKQRIGLSVGYDWPRYFVQLAYDPQVHLNTPDLLRLSAGTRF